MAASKSKISDPEFTEAELKVIFNSVKQNVENAFISRSRLIQKLADTRRDINKECGYPETSELDAELFRDYFDRWSFAARVVEVYPMESWKQQPSIFEDEDPDITTDFEQAFEDVSSSLTDLGEMENHYRSEDGRGNPLWSILKTADILSGIGHYGGLYFGYALQDGEELSSEVVKNSKSPDDLLSARPLDEPNMQIVSLESDTSNPRFGKPTSYNVTFDDIESSSGLMSTMRTQQVHHSRIVHLCDNRTTGAIIGIPRQRPVFNHILNLEKVYGGSGEMYWRGAFPGVTFETDPRVAGQLNIDPNSPQGKARLDSIKNMIEQMMNGLQRYGLFDAITMKTHAPTVSSPKDQIEAEINAIAIKIATPKRILTGSERGELASSQDDTTWNNRLTERRYSYLSPFMISPVVNTLIHHGTLPKPKKGFTSVWEEPTSQSATEKADILLKRTQAMAAYIAGDVQEMMEPIDFLTREMGMNPVDAKDLLKRKVDAVNEENQRLKDAADRSSNNNPADIDDMDDSEKDTE